MKQVKLFEQFINEAKGIFNTYSEVVGYEFNELVDAFKKLDKNNVVTYDKKEDVYYGHKKGSKTALWKYFKDESELHHSEKERDVLGLINAFDMVKRNHPWSK